MYARERSHSQRILYNSSFTFKEADVKVRFYRFRFSVCKIDDSGVVGVNSKMTWCRRASSWMNVGESRFNTNYELRYQSRRMVYPPSFKRTDLILTFCMNGTWIISFYKKNKSEKRMESSQRLQNIPGHQHWNLDTWNYLLFHPTV